MKLFHLQLTGRWTLDIITDYVVCATDETEARQLASEEEDTQYWKDAWLLDSLSSCVEIKKSRKPKILIEFFTPA